MPPLVIAPFVWSHIWNQALAWMPYILPAVSNLILVMLGVILSLPTLAEKVEKTPKWRMAVGVICLLAGLIGFAFDVSQRHASDISNKQLLHDTQAEVSNSNDLVKKTKGLMDAMTQMVTTLGLIQPQILAYNDRLSALNSKIESARRENNQAVVASLQNEKKESLTALLRLAPGITSEMQEYAKKWDMDETRLEKQHSDPQSNNSSQSAVSLTSEKERLDANNSREVLPLLTSANYLREELFRRFPEFQQTSQDKQAASIFAQALGGKPISSADMGIVARYVTDLVAKVGLPTPPMALSATLD